MVDDRLMKLRKAKGISMKQAAAELGLPYTTYVNYEKNINDPGSDILVKLAIYYGVTVDYLLGYHPPKTEEFRERYLEEAVEDEVMEDIEIGMGAGATHPLTMNKKVDTVDIIKTVTWFGNDFILDRVNTASPRALCLLDLEHLADRHFYFESVDDQMAPFIENGDFVLVNQDSEIKTGDIVIVVIGERNGTIREVEIDEYEIIIKSRNPYYPPISFKGESRGQIHFAGRVERIIRLL